MKVVSEKELIKLRAIGTKVMDARGKMVVPRLGPIKTEDPEPEKQEDRLAGAVQSITGCLQEITAAKQNTDGIVQLLTRCMAQLVSIQTAGPTPSAVPGSWRFEVKRNSDGFIQEILAVPAKGV